VANNLTEFGIIIINVCMYCHTVHSRKLPTHYLNFRILEYIILKYLNEVIYVNEDVKKWIENE
jgi:hypothetical protein